MTRTSKKLSLIPRELPNPIIVDILSRLPIKTLFDCRRVCKDWLSLISDDPYFANLHLSRSPASLLIKQLYFNGRESRQLRLVDLQIAHKTHPRNAQIKFTTETNIPNYMGDFKIANSCNGLLCLYSFCEIYVCNPILGEYISLPFCPQQITYRYPIVAFGFSLKTNQYKVIQFFFTYVSEVQVWVYTIGEGVWRRIGKVPFYLINHSFDSFVNGALHWLKFSHDSCSDFIRCFDFGSEQFQVVPESPEFGMFKNFPNYICVGVLQDSLSLCDFSSPLRIDIWVMKDYGVRESWRKEFVIGNAIGKSGRLHHCVPIMVLKSGEILMLGNKDALVMYNPKFGSFEKLKIYGIRKEFYATAHIPSFISLRDFANQGEHFDKLPKPKA